MGEDFGTVSGSPKLDAIMNPPRKIYGKPASSTRREERPSSEQTVPTILEGLAWASRAIVRKRDAWIEGVLPRQFLRRRVLSVMALGLTGCAAPGRESILSNLKQLGIGTGVEAMVERWMRSCDCAGSAVKLEMCPALI